MIEVGKTYKAIKENEKLIEFEVLKVNKKSYTILLNEKKETLWINKEGRLYLNNPNYTSRVMSRLLQPSLFFIEIVNEQQAKIFTMNKDLENHKIRISNHQAELFDLQVEENKIKNRKNDLNRWIENRINEVVRLEKELEEMKND